jgi:aspartyl-tRNA(Asn)/glutamyl-tRNA(Gln) amidotransferase subunit A
LYSSQTPICINQVCSDVTKWDSSRLTLAFARRELSPVELLQLLVNKINQDTQNINAFSTIDLEGAKQSAKLSEARYAAGSPLSPIDGVPVSVKDMIAMRGWVTQRGSKACEADAPATEDSPSVSLLHKAGAVLFGRTTTTEYGWEVGSSSPLHGITRNPRALGHTIGGSSCGAAAHLAKGWGPLALGSDAGGSVRIPASYGGIVGFKPTWGAIPISPPSSFAELAHLGPMARTVEDCAIAYKVLSQPDFRDPSSLFVRNSCINGRPIRIAWSLPESGEIQPSVVVSDAFQSAITKLSRWGFDLSEVKWHGSEKTAVAMWTLWSSRIFESFSNWESNRQDLLGDKLKAVFKEGEQLTAMDLALARTCLRDLVVSLSRQFEAYDLLLTPATKDVAPSLDTDNGHRWFDREPYSYPFNLTQQPALVWPLGKNDDELPFGIQLVGRRFDDAFVLNIGQQLEKVLRTP